MPLFEVFIPATDPNGFNITARIKADSWIQALKNGLSRLGDTTDVRNVMCDITEQGIDVTEPNSGRVFRIRELAEADAPKPAAPAPAAAAPAPAPAPVVPAPAPVVASAPPPAARAPTITSAPPPAVRRPPPPAQVQAPPPAAAPKPARQIEKPQAKAPEPATLPADATEPSPPPVAAAPAVQRMAKERAAVVMPKEMTPPPLIPLAQRFQAQVEEETIKEERPAGAAVQIGRGKVAPTRSIEDIIAELFDQTQQMYDKRDYKEAAAFILDLAHKNIPSDSGAVFIADFNRGDMFFASATGPKAKEVMKFRVGMGQGIVGFSAQECVSLAVSDVHRDPRFYAKISQSLGYETKSILCAPAQSEGRVYGAIELINKNTGTSFSGDEINLLNYLAHEFADYLMNTGQPGDIE